MEKNKKNYLKIMTLSYLNQCAMENVITDESCSLSDIQDYFECIAN